MFPDVPYFLTSCLYGQDGNAKVLRSPQFSALATGYELPPNVAIITLQVLKPFSI